MSASINASWLHSRSALVGRFCDHDPFVTVGAAPIAARQSALSTVVPAELRQITERKREPCTVYLHGSEHEPQSV